MAFLPLGSFGMHLKGCLPKSGRLSSGFPKTSESNARVGAVMFEQ